MGRLEELETMLKEPHVFGMQPEEAEGRIAYARLEKEYLLLKLIQRLEQGHPVLIVGINHFIDVNRSGLSSKAEKEIPDIHNFYPRKYYESIRHLGFGFFEGRTEHGTFSFDGGGAMEHIKFADGTWLSWSPLRVENSEVMKDLGYDCQKVVNILKEILSEK